jgi:hypothetical protein
MQEIKSQVNTSEKSEAKVINGIDVRASWLLLETFFHGSFHNHFKFLYLIRIRRQAE